MKSDDCKLADHEEGRGGSLCPRSLAQLTDIPFFLSMDEETSDATIQSESPGPRAPADRGPILNSARACCLPDCRAADVAVVAFWLVSVWKSNLRRFPPESTRAASQGRWRPHDAPARVEVHRTHVARELGIRELGKKSHRSATSSSPAPVVPRLPVPPAPWHPLIDYWLVVYYLQGEDCYLDALVGHPGRAGRRIFGAFLLL